MPTKRNRTRNQHRVVDSTTSVLIVFDPDNKPVDFRIDTADMPRIAPFQWTLTQNPGGAYYAYRKINGKNVFLHRILAGAPAGMDADHVSRDTLDCRQENLRVGTRKQNLHNRGVHRTNKLGLKGVILCCNRYQAQINVGRKVIVLGRFLDAVSAVRSYDAAAVKHHGEYACTNESIGLLERAAALPLLTDKRKSKSSANNVPQHELDLKIAA